MDIIIILQHKIDIQMEAYLDFESTDTRKIYDLRSFRVPGALLLGHYKYQEAGEVLERHQHPDMFEICYLEKGKQIYEIESVEYTLKGGDILLTKPNQVHGTSNYPESIGNLYWLILKCPDEQSPLLGLDKAESRKLYTELLHAPNVQFAANQRIQQYFRKLENQCRQTLHPLHSLHITNHILSILLELVELSKTKNDKKLPPDINRVMMHIQENIDEPLTIDELSEITGLSQSRFKHKFRQHIGSSPIDYINRQKIEKAKEMVLTTDSMKDIGYLLGYSSPAYFSHVFKKYTRMTPLQYKKKVNAKDNSPTA